MHRIEFQPSYVIHSRPYQETSLLLELFIHDHGRVSAIAKGARRPKARGRGLLQPFVPLLISCVGRHELLTIKDFDSSGALHSLQGRSLLAGLYLNELLMRLTQRFDPHPELFAIYKITLSELETTKLIQGREQIILRLFEKSLLKALGYELQLTKEVESGDKVSEEAWYAFDPERGPWLRKSKEDLSGDNAKIICRGKSLLALANNQLEDTQVLLDAKRLMRHTLRLHLGSRPLFSRLLF